MPKMNFENVFIGANPLGKTCLLNFPETEASNVLGHKDSQNFVVAAGAVQNRVVFMKDVWAKGVRGRK